LHIHLKPHRQLAHRSNLALCAYQSFKLAFDQDLAALLPDGIGDECSQPMQDHGIRDQFSIEPGIGHDCIRWEAAQS